MISVLVASALGCDARLKWIALLCIVKARGDLEEFAVERWFVEGGWGISDGFPRENGQKGLRNVSKWRREALEFGGYTVVGIGR